MKVAFLTLGCKVNFYETEKMEADFEANHVTVVPFKEKADVYIVNTCTVTNIADRKSRQMLHRARRLNPESIVVATGCYAESGKAQLEDDDTIDVVFANRDKTSIASQVLDYVKEHRRLRPGVHRLVQDPLYRRGHGKMFMRAVRSRSARENTSKFRMAATSSVRIV